MKIPIVVPRDAPQQDPAIAATRWVGTPPDVRRVSEALGTAELRINVLAFEPGVRSRPHRHSYDQVLVYLEGTGVVALDGGPEVEVAPGEFVLLPAGAIHMHGASAAGPARHLSMMREVDVDFDCEVPKAWKPWAGGA